MKNMVLTLIILLTCSFYINAQSASADLNNVDLNNIDLNKAVQMTLQNHPSVKQAQKQIDIVNARISQQKTSYSPEVEADLSYTRIGPVPSFDLPGGISLSIAPENNYDARLTYRYNLYDFGRRDAQAELVSSYRLSAEDNVEVLKSNLAFQAIQSFYSILFLRQSLQVKIDQIDNLNRHLDITKARIQSGTATDFDLSSTQVRVAQAENQRIDIENEIRKQEVNLRNLMGLPSGTPLNLTGSLDYLPVKVNTDSLLTLAGQQRNELKLAKDAEISADKQLSAARLSDMPSLGVNLAYGIKNGFEPNIYALRGNWAAGVLFRYPIYNGQKSRTLEEEAQAVLESAQAHTNDVELSIKTEINRAASDVLAAQNQVLTVRVQVDHARRALQRAELQYRDGIISNMDLLDAQTALAEARLSQLQIIYKNVITDFMLKRAIGDKVW